MVLKLFLLVILVIVILLLIRYLTWPPEPYPSNQMDETNIPKFKELAVDFKHHYDKKFLPFMASAVFDLKGNGQQYLFVGGGLNQNDKLFLFDQGKFNDVTLAYGINKEMDDATYGVAAIDVNKDGISDLFIARESGVYLLEYQDGKYLSKKLDIPLDPKAAAISFAVADLQKKGLVDLFVCAYIKKPYVEGQSIFNKKDYGVKSLLLINNGDNTFRDITDQAGLKYIHNTFQAVFVDLNKDGELDLVVAHDTGQVRTYKNNGDLTFTMMPNTTTDVYSYPMGIAVGDYNNDGQPELFFSNLGPFTKKGLMSTPPNMIVRGDLRPDQYLLRENILLKVDENFNFTDMAKEAKVADYEFGWGTVFQDFNNDGLQDIALAQNYIGFPPHNLFKLPCRLLQQLPDHTFASVEKKAGAANPYYAISPLYADFTNNGYPDLIYSNLNGPVRVFLNQGGENHYLKFNLLNQPESLGAVITVELADKVLTAYFVPTQGLCTYQTNSVMVGLGKSLEVKKATVKFTNGRSVEFDNPQIDNIIWVQ